MRGFSVRITAAVLSVRDAIVKLVILPAIYSPRLKNYTTAQSVRELPVFLILRYKYAGSNEVYGPSNEEHFLSGPLRTGNLAETVDYYYDQDKGTGLYKDSKLIDLVKRVQPDLMIMSSYSPFNKKLPQREVLKAIRAKTQIPLFHTYVDAYGDKAIEASKYMSGVVDLTISLDSRCLPNHFPDKSNFISLWTPLDFSVFYPGNGLRDIPLSLLGSIGSYRAARTQYLDHLKEENLPLYQTGGQRENLITLREYADIMRRSKMSLNFSHCVSGPHCLKGRVFEVMFSGALLLESENTEIAQYFTPMVDYVPFGSKEDLADKVRYYLEHEAERERIALNGYTKATTQYNHKEFWSKVLTKAADMNLFPLSPIAKCG